VWSHCTKGKKGGGRRLGINGKSNHLFGRRKNKKGVVGSKARVKGVAGKEEAMRTEKMQQGNQKVRHGLYPRRAESNRSR